MVATSCTPSWRAPFVADERVVRDEAHPERVRALRDEHADAPEPDDAERLAVQLDALPLRAVPLPRLAGRRCACGTLRACASSSAIVCSAAERMFDCGALTTMTPRRVASATSTLSRPIPARPTTTRSAAAASTSAVTCVALRITSAAAPWTASSSCLGSEVRLHVDVEAGRLHRLDAARGQRFGDEDPGCHRSEGRPPTTRRLRSGVSSRSGHGRRCGCGAQGARDARSRPWSRW